MLTPVPFKHMAKGQSDDARGTHWFYQSSHALQRQLSVVTEVPQHANVGLQEDLNATLDLPECVLVAGPVRSVVSVQFH